MALYTMVKNNTNGMPLPAIALLRENGEAELLKNVRICDFKREAVLMALLHTLPADDGFSMPAEFDEQQAVVILALPSGLLGRGTTGRAAAFRNVAVAVSRFADVLMLAPRAYVRQAREALPATIRVLEMEADDSWARDVAPTSSSTRRHRPASRRKLALQRLGRRDGRGCTPLGKRTTRSRRRLCARLGVDCYDASPVRDGGRRRPQRR